MTEINKANDENNVLMIATYRPTFEAGTCRLTIWDNVQSAVTFAHVCSNADSYFPLSVYLIHCVY
jgi:hypothetical protein